MSDLISRQAAIRTALEFIVEYLDGAFDEDFQKELMERMSAIPPTQPEPFVDADILKSCRFEYINACKIVAHPTPDTSKNDIYDANAVIKALHPIFGDAEF